MGDERMNRWAFNLQPVDIFWKYSVQSTHSHRWFKSYCRVLRMSYLLPVLNLEGIKVYWALNIQDRHQTFLDEEYFEMF